MTKFELVKKNIDNYNFMGLLGISGATDEFDNESRMISERISNEDTSVDIAKKICDVFNEQFNMNDSHDEYIVTAMSIKKELDDCMDI